MLSEADLAFGCASVNHVSEITDDRPAGGRMFWVTKRGFDIVVSLLGLPFIVCIGLVLMVLNPIGNPGRLFFRQQRMGRDGDVISVWKFRTMVEPTGDSARGPDDPLEVDRITPLGHWLRQTRVDELPQFLNVLVGEMSLIGPRPDCLDHAVFYAKVVPGYRSRFVVRPGISGFAQVRLGYAEGFALTARKTRLDLLYIRKAGWWLEMRILWRTLVVMVTGYGAR
jgi:lipopolysaccharide/colanic/teichoic acid biosynthesis glycosyltransferase